MGCQGSKVATAPTQNPTLLKTGKAADKKDQQMPGAQQGTLPQTSFADDMGNPRSAMLQQDAAAPKTEDLVPQGEQDCLSATVAGDHSDAHIGLADTLDTWANTALGKPYALPSLPVVMGPSAGFGTASADMAEEGTTGP